MRPIVTGTRFKNYHLEDRGRQYRVIVTLHGRVLGVALRYPAGGERWLDPRGRRARQLLAKLAAEKVLEEDQG